MRCVPLHTLRSKKNSGFGSKFGVFKGKWGNKGKLIFVSLTAKGTLFLISRRLSQHTSKSVEWSDVYRGVTKNVYAVPVSK